MTTDDDRLSEREALVQLLDRHEVSEPRGYAFVVCACGSEFGTRGSAKEHVAAEVEAAGWTSPDELAARERAAERRGAVEALREAVDQMSGRLDTFPMQGCNTRARWAENWLRDRADRLDRDGGQS